MPQSSFALLTNKGRQKEAAALANATAVVITHIAIGDGATVPSGGEIVLYNEVARKTISGQGVVAGASTVVYADIYLAAADGPYTIREAGLIDQDGDLIAIAHYDPPISKPTPDSGQTVEGTIRLEVAFTDLAVVTIKVDPSMAVALQRLSVLPWIPVLSVTTVNPPANPATGDTYVIPVGATGSWATHANKVAEYTAAGWAIVTPKDGHAVGLPDGRVFSRRAGAYVEMIATSAIKGLVELATDAEGIAGADATRALTPKSGMAAIASRLKGAEGNSFDTDWNTVTDWGFHDQILVGGSANGPGGGDARFFVWVLDYLGGFILTQIAVPWGHGLEQGWLMRGRKSDGTWTAWRSITADATAAAKGVVSLDQIKTTSGEAFLQATTRMQADYDPLPTVPPQATITVVPPTSYADDGQGDWVQSGSEIVCQRAGRYQVFARLSVAIRTGTSRASSLTVGVLLNGVAYLYSSQRLTVEELNTSGGGAAEVTDFVVGDRLKFYVYRDGTDLNNLKYIGGLSLVRLATAA